MIAFLLASFEATPIQKDAFESKIHLENLDIIYNGNCVRQPSGSEAEPSLPSWLGFTFGGTRPRKEIQPGVLYWKTSRPAS